MSISPEVQKQLSEPFPPEFIDTRPKGGKDLSFVGHARVTERLNAVDPNWTWEPLGFTDNGTPALIHDSDTGYFSLWGRMSVLGSVKVGVGTVQIRYDREGNRLEDQDIQKELVSDFIRNAAMRFGVGLDLWFKDKDGDDASQSSGGSARPPASGGQRSSGGGGGATEPQTRNLYRLWNKVLHMSREEFFQKVEIELGVQVTDDRQLTKQQASDMIRILKVQAGEPVDPRGDPGPSEPPPDHGEF